MRIAGVNETPELSPPVANAGRAEFREERPQDQTTRPPNPQSLKRDRGRFEIGAGRLFLEALERFRAF